MADIHDHVQIEQALAQLGLIPDNGDIPPIVIGEANDGANVGAGEGRIYRDKTGVTLNFRTLKQGSGIIIDTDEENDIVNIAAVGGGGGDVTGTPPSRTNDLAIYFDATGLKIKDSNLRHYSDSDEVRLEGEDPNSPSSWLQMIKLQYWSDIGSPDGTYITIGDSSQRPILVSVSDHYVNTLGKRIITELISSHWTVPKRGTIKHDSDDTDPILTLENTGTNPGESPIHIGNRNPEGAVTASQGAWYYREDGDNSTVYFKQTGTGNTGWVNLVGAFVTGPVSSVDEEIPRYNGTTGKIIKNSPAKIIDTTDTNGFQLKDPYTPFNWLDVVRAKRLTDIGTPDGTYILLGNTVNRTIIESLGKRIYVDTIASQVLHEAIPDEWDLPEAGSITNTGNDANGVLELKTTGTYPGESKIYVGNRLPENNVTADQGALYIRDNTPNARFYVKETGTGNTGWSNLINPNVGFYAYRSTGTQTIPASTETKVEFPNVQDDPGSDFNTSTYVFTAPTLGPYSFSASAKLNMDKDTECYLRLYHNTTLVSESSVASNFVQDMTVCVSIARRQMNQNDTMEVRIFQNDALSRTLQNTALHFAGAQLRMDL